VRSGLTFREYLELVEQPPGGLSDEVLRRHGALIRFTVAATGYKGDTLKLKWRVLDGVHPTPVKSDSIEIRPSADQDTVVTDPSFAPFPEKGSRLVLEGDLIAPDGSSIAHDERQFKRR
jgi:hypothetical protein